MVANGSRVASDKGSQLFVADTETDSLITKLILEFKPDSIIWRQFVQNLTPLKRRTCEEIFN